MQGGLLCPIPPDVKPISLSLHWGSRNPPNWTSDTLQAIDIETGPPEDERNLHGNAKPPKHPAVAYLSRLRSKNPEGSGTGPFANRRKTLNFMTGGLLVGAGERNRRSDVRPFPPI